MPGLPDRMGRESHVVIPVWGQQRESRENHDFSSTTSGASAETQHAIPQWDNGLQMVPGIQGFRRASPMSRSPDSFESLADSVSDDDSERSSTPITPNSSTESLVPAGEPSKPASSEMDTTLDSQLEGKQVDTNAIPETVRPAPEVPPPVLRRLLDFSPPESRRSLRLTCKTWSRTVDKVVPLNPPAANIVPPEILFQIYSMLSPRDFDNARHTCSQWMRVSLDKDLLEGMLKKAGWWDAWQRDCLARSLNATKESHVWRLSKRFSTECLLSGRKANVERSGFLTTGIVDFSHLARESLPTESPAFMKNVLAGPYTAPRITAAVRDPAFSRTPRFSASKCGRYLLVTTGCMIYVYHLCSRKTGDNWPRADRSTDQERPNLDDKDLDIMPISSIGCPYEVLSAAIDTSNSKLVVAALLRGRMGMVCDIKRVSSQSPSEAQGPSLAEVQEAIASNQPLRKMVRLSRTPRHYYHDICSAEDPPRSVSICPGRRCIAFGCGSGIELHWVDQKTNVDSRKLFPMSQPAEVVHFLSNPSVNTPAQIRLISSLAGPGASGCQCYNSPDGEEHPCQFHLSSGVRSFTHWTPRKNGSLSLVKATHCHHYRAIPVNDGLHLLFIEPTTGFLCIGSDAPIGGPTSLTRALICVPPFEGGTADNWKEDRVPTVFASGSDLSWGLRIVAAYQDKIVLYSVPSDVLNVIQRERRLQGEGVMGDSDLARDWFLDSECNSQRRGSLAQNQNGDWEFLLKVSYRPTAMMWPLKIYGKEIGRMTKVVDFAIQTSNGGARVWAFGASGEARIFDIDTCTSKNISALDIGVRSLSVGPDGSIASAKLMGRAESGLLSPLPARATRKRKQLSQPAPFDREILTAQYPPRVKKILDVVENSVFPKNPSSSPVSNGPAKRRRPSFAACIVDLKIPDLGPNEGNWLDNASKAEGENSPPQGSDGSEFHDFATYDPQDLRKAFLSTPAAGLHRTGTPGKMLINPVMYNEGYSAWSKY
ncbi:hypothetical protein DTO027B9_7666 [Paecilomyces variotii]|nr:hypothetical protein DTO027B9_7666 [Paecilomyces variotii]